MLDLGVFVVMGRGMRVRGCNNGNGVWNSAHEKADLIWEGGFGGVNEGSALALLRRLMKSESDGMTRESGETLRHCTLTD